MAFLFRLNSIKYRKANESPVVKIEIDSITDEDFCKITFTDNGLGVEIANLEDFQLKSQNSTNAGGLGLGLTIIKKQITALQGKMLIDGKNNIGTTFTVWIPKMRNETI